MPPPYSSKLYNSALGSQYPFGSSKSLLVRDIASVARPTFWNLKAGKGYPKGDANQALPLQYLVCGTRHVKAIAGNIGPGINANDFLYLQLKMKMEAFNGVQLTPQLQERLGYLQGRTRNEQRNQQKKALGAEAVLAMERTRVQSRDVNAGTQEAARKRAKKCAKTSGVNRIDKRKVQPYPKDLDKILGKALVYFFRYNPLRTKDTKTQNAATETAFKKVYLAMFDRAARPNLEHFLYPFTP
ncbi:unnamed protein product [Cylindrotheca closterium]|uniref:Uncharacterized protein n=1 Tax=Cylindrotheca closterium TaxID=2856 RepID=A0AAD2CBP3_9STRA|nr:unnamed protein product [Cylindrotheca closterium]